MSSLSCDAEATNPLYQYLQIELTNRCDLSCKTCRRAVPGLCLKEQDLSKASLQRLEPAFQCAASVHLQGWGEESMRLYLSCKEQGLNRLFRRVHLQDVL